MRRRPARRRLKPGRKPSYKQSHALHLFEEQFVLALLIERGSGGAKQWDDMEPGRFYLPYLRQTFKRLRRKRLVNADGVIFYPRRDGRRLSHEVRYVPVPELKGVAIQCRTSSAASSATASK